LISIKLIGDVSRLKLVKTRMAKSVLDAGWGMLKIQLQYKGQQAGRSVLIIDERNTTRACSSCGALTGPTGLDSLIVRTWMCSGCGDTHDRDVNAAKNILSAGRCSPSVSGNKSFTVSHYAEPDLPSTQGADTRADGGGMNTGNANRHMSNEIRQKQKKHAHGARGL
jgi:transposase